MKHTLQVRRRAGGLHETYAPRLLDSWPKLLCRLSIEPSLQAQVTEFYGAQGLLQTQQQQFHGSFCRRERPGVVARWVAF